MEYMTNIGFFLLKKQLHNKIKERPEILRKVSETLLQGDLHENGGYIAAKEAQNDLELRITELQNILNNCNIIEPPTISDRVQFGCTVRLFHEQLKQEITYKIVGRYETCFFPNAISFDSPLAKKLICCSVNNKIVLENDNHINSYIIKDIYYE
jgi:transcription elongation factor GreA